VKQAHLREEVQLMSELLEKSYEQEVFERGLAQGEAMGETKGRTEAYRDTLEELLRQRFAELPAAVQQQIASANASQLRTAISRLLTNASLDELFQ
jgi:predicted transposase YdaD